MSVRTQAAFGIWNGLAPAGPDGGPSPKALPMTFDFSTVAEITGNLLTENLSGALQFAQSIYVDNRDNPNEFQIIFEITGQRLVVPAGATGIWPVFAPDQLGFVARSTINADAIVHVIFLNVPMPLTQWGPMAVTVGNVTATFAPTVGPFTNFSSTVAAGGVSQTCIPANANRLRVIIQNPADVTLNPNGESLFINFTDPATMAGDSLEITAGGSYDSQTGPVSGEEITITAPTTGAVYVAKEQ